ncbi:MAG TPA: SRPBCC family protein [Actinoplanes sp.]|nr:SRPBCC family protein [Actinoplanes sp.]
MTLPPIRRQVVVAAPPEQAFDMFTRGIGSWWPVDRHSVHGPGATPAFRDGRLIEAGPAGEEVAWGTVLAWDPPHRLRLTWHPGYGAERASEVEVTFTAATDGQTVVTLTHRDWERFPDPGAARDSYGAGWPVVLGAYADRLPSASVSA